MLRRTIDFLRRRANEKVDIAAGAAEIIVVNDGSSDTTSQIVGRFAQQFQDIRIGLIELSRNRGKGAAVSEGVLAAKGEYILFADADGSTEIADLAKLERGLINAPPAIGIACGSRALQEASSVVRRSPLRRLLMNAFRLFVQAWGMHSIRDTQCGFKLFRRSAARRIFQNLRLEGWAFDLEMLLLAEYLKIGVIEVPVSWTEMSGSKLSLVRDAFGMVLDLMLVRMLYALRTWRIYNHAAAFPGRVPSVGG